MKLRATNDKHDVITVEMRENNARAHIKEDRT